LSAWRPKTDLDKAKAFLPLTPVTKVAEPAENDTPDTVDNLLTGEEEDGEKPVAADTAVSSATAQKEPSTAPFRIVTLEDLSREQAEAFARARGVSDTKAFGDAI
jgi:hypothetical protein